MHHCCLAAFVDFIQPPLRRFPTTPLCKHRTKRLMQSTGTVVFLILIRKKEIAWGSSLQISELCVGAVKNQVFDHLHMLAHSGAVAGRHTYWECSDLCEVFKKV